MRVVGRTPLCDPRQRIAFAIENHFSAQRFLTPADFDIVATHRSADGTWWLLDALGPLLLHADPQGAIIEAPRPLPDPRQVDQPICLRHHPSTEEGSVLRVMNALRAHAIARGANCRLVISPDHQLLADGRPDTGLPSRLAPPPGSGLTPACSKIIDVGEMRRAGYGVIPYTVNDKSRMLELMRLGVSGLISDRPDLLYQAVAEFAASLPSGGAPPMDGDGLIDGSRFDAQGHRGARDLRPENTLPAMEAALDLLMTTLELDCGITRDGVAVVCHDPFLAASKCRRADGAAYTAAEQRLIKDLTVTEIQESFVCDALIRGPTQRNDAALSPVAAAFVAPHRLPALYVMPTLRQVFEFAGFYADYQRTLGGEPAQRRARNAARVRFNIETKINPRRCFAARTADHASFVGAIGRVIAACGMQSRADIQSFDWRTLLETQMRFPQIRTIALFGDFPAFADPDLPGSDDGTNLQGEDGHTSPWLAGLVWPYRNNRRVQLRGGRPAAWISATGGVAYVLAGQGAAGSLALHRFDIAHGDYSPGVCSCPAELSYADIAAFAMCSPMLGLVIEGKSTPAAGPMKVSQLIVDAARGAAERREQSDIEPIRVPLELTEQVLWLGRSAVAIRLAPTQPAECGVSPAAAAGTAYLVARV